MSLYDVPEEDARVLLAMPKTCINAMPWVDEGRKGLGFCAGAGLVDKNGQPTGLYAEFSVSILERLKCRHYQLSIFKLGRRIKERVYQLDVKAWPKPPKDRHQWPHEHIGRRREIGDASWRQWDYDEVLRYFCVATNTTLVPDLEDPSVYKLLP